MWRKNLWIFHFREISFDLSTTKQLPSFCSIVSSHFFSCAINFLHIELIVLPKKLEFVLSVSLFCMFCSGINESQVSKALSDLLNITKGKINKSYFCVWGILMWLTNIQEFGDQTQGIL